MDLPSAWIDWQWTSECGGWHSSETLVQGLTWEVSGKQLLPSLPPSVTVGPNLGNCFSHFPVRRNQSQDPSAKLEFEGDDRVENRFDSHVIDWNDWMALAGWSLPPPLPEGIRRYIIKIIHHCQKAKAASTGRYWGVWLNSKRITTHRECNWIFGFNTPSRVRPLLPLFAITNFLQYPWCANQKNCEHGGKKLFKEDHSTLQFGECLVLVQFYKGFRGNTCSGLPSRLERW